MTSLERQPVVWEILQDFRGLDSLKELFWSELSYQRVNQPLSRRRWPETAAKALAEDPVLFAAGGQDNAFQIIYARLADRLLLIEERRVVSHLLREHPYALFIFSDSIQSQWHLLNVKHDEQSQKRRLFRRITIGPEERLRTASERIALLDLASLSPDPLSLSPLTIQECHDQAFDVEAVTRQFFEQYKALFGDLIVPRLIRERFFFAANPEGLVDIDMFFHGRFIDRTKVQVRMALVNSTVVYLLLEIFGRHNIEGRFNIYGPELKSLPIPNPEFFSSDKSKEIVKSFKILVQRNVTKILDEIKQSDRHAFDAIIFDTLGFT